MSSVTQEDANDAAAQDRVEQRAAEREKLRTSRFDLVTSFLMALMLFIGTLTVMVVIIFITTRWAFPPLAMERSSFRWGVAYPGEGYYFFA